MHHERLPFLCASPESLIAVVENEPQELSAPPGPDDLGTQQACGQIRGPRLVSPDRAQVVDPDRRDAAPGDMGVQAAPHHLDLGQLRHWRWAVDLNPPPRLSPAQSRSPTPSTPA